MVRSRSVSRRVDPPPWRARRVPDRVLARRPDAQALHTNAAPVPRSRAKGSARTETATAATAAKETPWLCLPTLPGSASGTRSSLRDGENFLCLPVGPHENFGGLKASRTRFRTLLGHWQRAALKIIALFPTGVCCVMGRKAP